MTVWIDSNNGYMNLDHVLLIQPVETAPGAWILRLHHSNGHENLPAVYTSRFAAQEAARSFLSATVRVN